MAEPYAQAARGFGSDPTFNPYSRLFDAGILGQEANYYNTSQQAGEISELGLPYGFFLRPVPGYELGSPIVVQVRLSGRCRLDARECRWRKSKRWQSSCLTGAPVSDSVTTCVPFLGCETNSASTAVAVNKT